MGGDNPFPHTPTSNYKKHLYLSAVRVFFTVQFIPAYVCLFFPNTTFALNINSAYSNFIARTRIGRGLIIKKGGMMAPGLLTG